MLLHFFLISAQSFKDFLPTIVCRLQCPRQPMLTVTAANHELFHLDDVPPPVALLRIGLPRYLGFRMEFRKVQGFGLARREYKISLTSLKTSADPADRPYLSLGCWNHHVDHLVQHRGAIHRCLLLDYGCLLRSQHPSLMGDPVGPQSSSQGTSLSLPHAMAHWLIPSRKPLLSLLPTLSVPHPTGSRLISS